MKVDAGGGGGGSSNVNPSKKKIEYPTPLGKIIGISGSRSGAL